ncbi:MAG: hypothetical protein ACI9IJ_002268, partial [Psychromonas sp.]
KHFKNKKLKIKRKVAFTTLGLTLDLILKI